VDASADGYGDIWEEFGVLELLYHVIALHPSCRPKEIQKNHLKDGCAVYSQYWIEVSASLQILFSTL
jgi:hypothetical protein